MVHGTHDLFIALILKHIGYFEDYEFAEIKPVDFGSSLRFELI